LNYTIKRLNIGYFSLLELLKEFKDKFAYILTNVKVVFDCEGERRMEKDYVVSFQGKNIYNDAII
jgi:hypothetical protein